MQNRVLLLLHCCKQGREGKLQQMPVVNPLLAVTLQMKHKVATKEADMLLWRVVW